MDNDLLELRVVGLEHPDAVVLIAAVQQEYVQRYGGVDSTPVQPGQFGPPHGLFLVGYVGGTPVTCGGWRLRSAAPDDPELRDGDVELKRMYVVDDHRGRGYARRLLAELERAAAGAGGRRMILETGDQQPEAIELYLSSGYRESAGFGVYRHGAESRYFAKPLAR